LTERRKIVSNYQLIDIKLATIDEQDIQVCITNHIQAEVNHAEQIAIQQEEPTYNQSQSSRTYTCQGCSKIYKSRLPF
jgi:hypothetical protein